MRKLITLILLVITIGVNAQMVVRMPVMAAHDTATTTSYCDEYQAVLDEMTTDPSPINQGYQNAMVESLVDGGYWGRMEWFHCYATEINSDNEALIDWHNPSTGYAGTNVGSTAWTTLEGYTGDGTADYINTNWDPSTDSDTSTRYDATIAIYNRLELGSATYYDIGASDGIRQFSFSSSYSNTVYARVHSSGSINTSNEYSQGFFMATRRSNTNTEIYRNGSSLVESTSNTSGLIVEADVVVLARGSSSGNPTNFTINQAAIAFVMTSISDAQATSINTIIETYMDAINKGVQ